MKTKLPKTKLPKTKFYSKAAYLLSKHMQLDDLDELINDYEITQEEINLFKQNHQKSKIITNAMFSSKDEKEMIYNTLDKKFVEKHPNLVVFMRGENVSFYEYRNGVYVHLNDIDMINLVDDLMDELGLLDYRSKRRSVSDTVSRIGSLLCRKPGKHFSDETLFNNKWYLNLTNGLLDTETYTLCEHTPEYFSTVQIPFPYDKDAECPEFIKFVNQVSDNKPEVTQMIQEMYGYGLEDGNKRHKVFYLYGATARNGKSTTAKILCGLIGLGNVSTLSLEQIAGESSSVLTSIVNKQINFSDELSSKYIDSSKLTAMSSESLIEINPKYKNSFTYKVKAKFIVACNDLPRFHDGQGMKHRMISIPFRVYIKDEKRILDYDQVLLKKEGSGILNWAIEGLKLLRNNKKFSISEDSLDDIQENIYGGNSVYAFMDETYVYDSSFTTPILSEEMYGKPAGKDSDMTMYKLYCHMSGIKPVALHTFRIELKRFAAETQKIQFKRVNNDRCYVGLQQKNDEIITGRSLYE